MSFRVLGSRRLATGVFLGFDRVHLLGPDHRTSLRDVIRHPGGVGILPVDAEDHVWLIRQFRIAAGGPLLEIPAGKLDRAGEEVERTAARELEEELGLSASRITRLGQMRPSSGYTDEVIHLYAAEGIVVGDRRPEGAEEHAADAVRLPLAEALAMVDRGELDDAKTQIALMAWARRSG